MSPLEEAFAYIERLNRLPGPQSKQEMGKDEAQDALRLIAKAKRAANRTTRRGQ